MSNNQKATRIIIMGAAGRDFHNFNMVYRNDPDNDVIAFTATQIPDIAVCAVRTGCGKSPTTRWLSKLLKQRGLKVAVIRHPMPYGDLERQAVQRFTSRADLDIAECTVDHR